MEQREQEEQNKKQKGTRTGQDKYQPTIKRQASPKAGSSPTAQKKQGENQTNERKQEKKVAADKPLQGSGNKLGVYKMPSHIRQRSLESPKSNKEKPGKVAETDV